MFKRSWNITTTFNTELSGWEIILDLHCRGYYDPGKISGPPERCYPPEGDDEREVTGGAMRELHYYNDYKDGKIVGKKEAHGPWRKLSEVEYRLLGDILADDIGQMELETEDYHSPY